MASSYNNARTKTIKIKIIKSVTLSLIPATSRLVGSFDLDAEISEITNALGNIYRFYRFSRVHLKIPPFVNTGQTNGENYLMACTYVPADTGTTLPTVITDIEGTNLGLFSASVLNFQHMTISKKTLVSQNYKWWTTPGSATATDENVQGRFVFITNDVFSGVAALRFFMEIDLAVQFKTLLDPALL